MNETRQLAEYAAAVRYADLPAHVVQRAKDVIADTVATVLFGHDLPWSRMIIAYAESMGTRGKSRILGPGLPAVRAPLAALANGAMAHAFELDNLTWPNSGVHPGATMFVPALAVAQERGIGGRELIAAFVAGAETMIRIGRATKHNNESRGFHAPGTTGPFGAAIAVGRLMRLDADKMTNAIGIAGSLAGGLLEFARSGTGAMVKRLHLGRAAESGVMAASLAASGFTGPHSVLEGPFGYLNVFCGEHDLAALTHGLGEEYATLRIMLKRFPCHITAHTSVQAVEDLRAEHKYSGDDVASINIAGTEKMATINNIPQPADLMMAQYSIPFCVALAHYKNPRDPRSFNAKAVGDGAIRALAARVTMSVADEARHARTLASTVTVTLKDGRMFSRRVADFKGTPESPLNAEEMREKFLLLTRHCNAREMARLFERLQNLENERSLDFVKASAPKKRVAKHARRSASKT
jgi:2-methylcitrate dehydratase PrpD